ncbi:MAG: glycosyltransferase family 4 protein [Candidatus Omnitrophica bacterium]|nr:glycosyltransferase family 4 protein [Candidatus Omnitrophota bacterium]
MKIAQISTIWWRTPPVKYGGSERIVSYLTEELVKRKHEVTLYASGDSITKAKLVSVVSRYLRKDKVPWGAKLYPLLNIAKAFEDSKEFDLIHYHEDTNSGYFGLLFSKLVNIPVICTSHHGGPVLDEIKVLSKIYKNVYFTALSKFSKKTIPDAKYAGVVYNGLPIENIKYNENPKNYILFLGRMSPAKGADQAVKFALKTRSKLIMAGKLDYSDKKFFDKKIKPFLKNKNIKYLGEVTETKKQELLRNAKTLIYPVTYDEIFSLVVIEAMASGTPVIAYNKGAMKEIIKNNKTGFIVNNLKQAMHALQNIDEIDRIKCRKYIEKNFSVKKMVDGYEKIYREVIRDFRSKNI